jgi:hypothetical protein
MLIALISSLIYVGSLNAKVNRAVDEVLREATVRPDWAGADEITMYRDISLSAVGNVAEDDLSVRVWGAAEGFVGAEVTVKLGGLKFGKVLSPFLQEVKAAGVGRVES